MHIERVIIINIVSLSFSKKIIKLNKYNYFSRNLLFELGYLPIIIKS